MTKFLIGAGPGAAHPHRPARAIEALLGPGEASRRVMMMTDATLIESSPEDTFAAMVGEYVWTSRAAAPDAILRLDFGSPHLHVIEPSPRAIAYTGRAIAYTGNVRTVLGRRVVLPVGRWHLFVESGLRRVTVSPQLWCDRADAERDDLDAIKRVTKCLSLLDGQKLATAPTQQDCVWRFAFDLGGELSIRTDPTTDPREAIWTLVFEDAGPEARPRAGDEESILTSSRWPLPQSGATNATRPSKANGPCLSD